MMVNGSLASLMFSGEHKRTFHKSVTSCNCGLFLPKNGPSAQLFISPLVSGSFFLYRDMMAMSKMMMSKISGHGSVFLAGH